jgi:hypothetical protein
MRSDISQHSLDAHLPQARHLLAEWDKLDRHSDDTVKCLLERLPSVRALLKQVSARVDNARWHTTGWNAFDILGRVWKEDAHSDTLAWLLCPWEAHGLGDRFLRAFVAAVGYKSDELPDSYVVRDVATRKRLCDGSVIDIEVLGYNWVLAVENKIGCRESSGQTKKYAEYYDRLAKSGKKVFCVFLTPTGDLAEAEEFRPLSYRRLRQILNEMSGPSDATQVVRWLADHICSDLGGVK